MERDRTDPKGKPWYISTEKASGETLQIAGQRNGYTLVSRATWLSAKAKTPGLRVLVEGDPTLHNPYHVILVSSAKNTAGAKAFASWLVSPAGQKAIGSFGVDKYGQQLFVPDAGASSSAGGAEEA